MSQIWLIRKRKLKTHQLWGLFKFVYVDSGSALVLSHPLPWKACKMSCWFTFGFDNKNLLGHFLMNMSQVCSLPLLSQLRTKSKITFWYWWILVDSLNRHLNICCVVAFITRSRIPGCKWCLVVVDYPLVWYLVLAAPSLFHLKKDNNTERLWGSVTSHPFPRVSVSVSLKD